MAALFSHTVNLFNVTPEQNAINPWELHNFTYPHFAIPDPGTCILGYTLSGDIPKGISVDGAGTISGKIKHFGLQPSCQTNYPEEKPKLNGSNYLNTGRFMFPFFDFVFSITVTWKEQDSNGVPCVIPGTTTKNCIIRVILDNSINNKIFADNYNGKEKVNDIDIELKFGEASSPSPMQRI